MPKTKREMFDEIMERMFAEEVLTTTEKNLSYLFFLEGFRLGKKEEV